jgi:hypothetical protein
MPVGDAHAAILASYLAGAGGNVPTGSYAGDEPGPVITESSVVIQGDGIVSGAVGDENLSGMHLGGDFQTPISNGVSYSAFAYFGDADIEGVIRIAGAKYANGDNADTTFIVQTKVDDGNGLEWKTLSITELSNISHDPF